VREQIINLDPHDNYHSMRDKIGWSQADRILLVLPNRRRKRLFNRPLDLQLVQRHAAQLGAKLALVTDDPTLCDYADVLGIQVFDKVDDSHLQAWRSTLPAMPQRQTVTPLTPEALEDREPVFTLPRIPWLQSRRFKLTVGALIFFSVVVIVAYMLALTLPGATITLTPHTQSLSAIIPIVADPDQSEIDPVTGLIPARTLSVVVSGSAEVATTGSVDEATQRSSGTVTFTNLTNLAVRIPAGTAVRTTSGTPVRFVTQQDVNLEARRGASGAALVVAEESGPPGNVSAGQINRIEGPLSVPAAVTNENGTGGGEVQQVASVTVEDRQRVRDALLADLKQQGYAQLLTQLNEGEFAPLESLQVSSVLDEAFDHFAGEKAERLKLDMRLEVGVTAASEAPAFVVGQAVLNEQLGDTLATIPNTTLFSRDPATTTVDEDGRIHFNISAAAEASAIINPEDVRSVASWQLANEARSLIDSRFPLVRPPAIEVTPDWFPRLPWLTWRIDVVIQPASP
jgi:Baseplate J-like protein